MGYFANATENDFYQQEYCYNCVHDHEEYGCPIMNAHWLWNYDECNKEDSLLHKIIPRDKKGFNEQCIFFIEDKS